MKNNILCIFILCNFFIFIFIGDTSSAQTKDSAITQISWQQKDSAIHFQSHLRPLRQIAGAPEAFYTYFWEFGDGDFSFNKSPRHTFPDTGEYIIRVYATNNYDDGKAPPTRPRKIKVNNKGNLATNYHHDGFFEKDHNLQLKVNRMPKPNEDMVCIIGYKNPKNTTSALNGSVVLFYNDTKFKKKNFGLTNLRKYHQEKTVDMTTLLAKYENQRQVPIYALNEVATHGPKYTSSFKRVSASSAADLLMYKQTLFDSKDALHFENLQAGEKRYVYAVLHTTPEMIKDTNATVTLSAMMIPDDPTSPILETNLELQIVASHDPNRMMLGNRILNYRFTGKNKKQKYEIHFQNTGKGPAKKVDLGIKLPAIVNPHTLEIKDMYPKCSPCATAYPGESCLDTIISQDSIHFVFKNIYLPGIRQKNVEDKDSTRGFVAYQLRFKEKPPKLPFWSQAGIVFDKNEPVYTNKMHTRFSPGISPAIIAGYQMGFNDELNPNAFLVGAALAPYSPYKTYFQVEAYLGLYGEDSYNNLQTLTRDKYKVLDVQGPNGITSMEYRIVKSGYRKTRKLVTLNLIPLEVRNNLNDWLSVGAGLWLRGNLYENISKTPKMNLTPLPNNSIFSDTTLLLLENKETVPTKNFSHINIGGFLDMNIGRVRVGPALGVRFYHFFNPDKTGLMLYAIWRL